MTASHEILEAATDALPTTNPAYALPSSSSSPWVLLGGEVGDLCELPTRPYREGGFVAQRIYSNWYARTNALDPCVPADPSRPFYLAQPSPDQIQTVPAGGVVSYAVHAWSTAPLPSWTVIAAPAMGDFTPTFDLTPTIMNNGTIGRLTVTVPARIASNSFAVFYLYSSPSGTDYQAWPMAILVR
jgi:hypothetical protein